MEKTITVKGVGRATTSPDYVVLSMKLESRDMEYQRAMEIAALNIDHLNVTLESVGFEKKMVKTTNFNVRTDYDSVKGRDGNYKRVFNGYIVRHDLKVEFDFESERLTKALAAVGTCLAHPELSIAFTVKDTTSINEEMLRSATVNARRKAEILCSAAGVVLGELQRIDYSWGELNVYSDTRYECCDEMLVAPMMAKSIEIEPDDIEVSDTATFIWGIRQ